MDKRLDWNLIRSFVAVCQAGSLSGAARKLGSSQPTLGRHIHQLEQQLGLTLFLYHPRGLELTAEGESLRQLAEQIQHDMLRLEQRAIGMEPSIEGSARISASENIALYVLPDALKPLCEQYPELELEIVVQSQSANLLRRDADVAVRMYKPEQQDLIARKIVDVERALFASDDYIKTHGAPQRLAELKAHRTIGFDRELLHLQALERLGLKATREDFSIRSDAQAFHIKAMERGLGIGALDKAIAAQLPHLIQVCPQVQLPPLPIWLVAHQELRNNPRIRVVFDAIAQGLTQFYTPSPGD